MTIATLVNKTLRFKKETAGQWGVAPGATGAQLLRRKQSTFDLVKETYSSDEVRTDFQVSDMRHGARSVSGSVNGLLSPGTYALLFAAACRRDFTAGTLLGSPATATSTGAKTDISAIAGGFQRGSGSFLTDGFWVGHMVRLTNTTTPADPNGGRNFFVTGVTATNLNGIFLDSTGQTVTAKAAGDSITISTVGKHTWVPTTGHTDDSFSFEHYYNDLTESELFTGCKISGAAVKLPAKGNSTVDFTLLGKDMTTQSGSSYFTSPTPETTTGLLAAVNGACYVNGVKVANLTGLDLNFNGNMSAEAVVGSNAPPDIFEGPVQVTGQFTAFFENVAYRDVFVNETEASIVLALTADNSKTADFITIAMDRIKTTGASKNGDKAIVQTIPFTALLNVNGTGTNGSQKTTIRIQDSAA